MTDNTKTHFIYQLIFTILLIFNCQNPTRKQQFFQILSIDAPEVIPGKIALIETRSEYQKQKKRLFTLSDSIPDKIEKLCSLEVCFSIRDTNLITSHLYPILLAKVHPYFKIRAISTIAHLQYKPACGRIIPLLSDSNELIKEYAADAIGVLCEDCWIDSLEKLEKSINNLYVKTALEASLKKIRTPDTLHINQVDTSSGVTTEPFFCFICNREASYQKPDVIKFYPEESQIPESKRFIYPHQQYKLMNDGHRYRRISFGMEVKSGYFHVGEDSGWDLEGLPIHAIADGVVVMQLYEPSWGNLIAVETKLRNGLIINHFYGHLSADINVKVGEKVLCGQRIGRLGASMSVENGGYRAHLHLGIAKGSLKKTGVIGYYSSLKPWFNPVTFLYKMVE